MGRWEGEDMTQLLRKALWGQQGSHFLTAHVYLPARMVSALQNISSWPMCQLTK